MPKMHTITVTRKLSIPADKLPELRADYRRLTEPGFGGGMNICFNDGYYAKSIERKWRMSLSDIEALAKKPKRRRQVR